MQPFEENRVMIDRSVKNHLHRFRTERLCFFMGLRNMRKRKKKRMTEGLLFLLAMGLTLSLSACGSRNDMSGEDKDVTSHEEGLDPSKEENEVIETEEQKETDQDDEPSIDNWKEKGYGILDVVTGIKGWQQFCQKTLVEEANAGGDGNWIYCPINLYQSLAMLTEISQGDTRAQITDLLGEDAQKKIRQNLPYEGYHPGCIKGEGIPADEYYLANSLWLNQQLPYSKEVLKILQRHYNASVHQGKMGKEMDEKIQKWLNQVTRNRLKEQVSRIETRDSEVMRMYSTLYLEQQWATPFDKDRTKKGTFHGKAYNTCGNISEEERWEDTICEYMYRTMDTEIVKTDQYMSVKLPFLSGLKMRIVLPEEGVTLEELCTGKGFSDLLTLCGEDYLSIFVEAEEMGLDKENIHSQDTEYAHVEFSMPKFEITSGVDLENVLNPLGVTDMFEADKADFLSLLDRNIDMETCPPIYASSMQQTTNMKIDENGCTVASYTETSLGMGALADEPQKTYEMHCDRPFLFFITNYEGQVLFAGAVQRVE